MYVRRALEVSIGTEGSSNILRPEQSDSPCATELQQGAHSQTIIFSGKYNPCVCLKGQPQALRSNCYYVQLDYVFDRMH